MKRERTDQQIILAVVDAACMLRDRKVWTFAGDSLLAEKLDQAVDDYRQRIRERDGELMEAKVA